jgi:serine/threonine protein kinase
LEIKCTLGVGAFGKVKLVKPKVTIPIKTEDHPSASSSNPEVDPSSGTISSPDTKTTNGTGATSTPNKSSATKQEVIPIKKTYALKVLSKYSIVESGLQEHVMNEKEIMEELNHPFILKFHCAMQDDKYIYFLLEVLLGGELFKFLRAETQFPESWSKFYSASVLLAFCQIHSKNIAYRDLKPENLVLDSNGYLKLVDFGLAKKVDSGKTWTLCGTPDYLAPEVILNEGHDWAVDYWGLGVLIYEMTAGSPPFYADDPMDVYERILSGHVPIPSHFSRGLADLVKKLLKTYQSKRLGRTKGGTSSVMKHKWFSGFDWDALLKKEMEVPIKPKIKDMEDTSNFDEYPDDEDESNMVSSVR